MAQLVSDCTDRVLRAPCFDILKHARLERQDLLHSHRQARQRVGRPHWIGAQKREHIDVVTSQRVEYLGLDDVRMHACPYDPHVGRGVVQRERCRLRPANGMGLTSAFWIQDVFRT